MSQPDKVPDMTVWPTKYTIKSRLWTIKYVDRLKDTASDDPENPDNDLLGCSRADLKEITISRDQSIESMKDTVVHELMHAIYSTMPGVDHDDEEGEENWVLGATEAFFEIVRNSGVDWWS